MAQQEQQNGGLTLDPNLRPPTSPPPAKSPIPLCHTWVPPVFQDNDHNRDPKITYEDRIAVRAVLHQPVSQDIALIYHSSGTFWSLPGSRIHGGEKRYAALARIIMEETGCDIDPDIGRPFLRVDGWTKDWGVYIHEISYCYSVKVKGSIVEGVAGKRYFQPVWAPPQSVKNTIAAHANRCTSPWGRFSLFRDLNIMTYYTWSTGQDSLVQLAGMYVPNTETAVATGESAIKSVGVDGQERGTIFATGDSVVKSAVVDGQKGRTTVAAGDSGVKNTKVDEQNGRTTIGKGKSVVKSAKMDGQKGRTTVAKGESAVKAAKVDGQKGETIVASMSDGRKRRKLYSEALRS